MTAAERGRREGFPAIDRDRRADRAPRPGPEQRPRPPAPTLSSSTPRPTRSGITPDRRRLRRRRPRGGRVPARRAHDAVDEPQDRRLERRREVGEGRVGPVGGERVLDEVVGADAEEVGHLGEAVGHERGRRDLDHHARAARRTARRPPRGHARRPGGSSRPRAATTSSTVETIGSMIAELAAGRRLEKGLELVVEQGRSIAARGGAPDAERRVGLGSVRLPGRGLVAADVERPEHDRPVPHRGADPAIGRRAARRRDGGACRPRNSSSVRTRPMPAAPARAAASASATEPTLALDA